VLSFLKSKKEQVVEEVVKEMMEILNLGQVYYIQQGDKKSTNKSMFLKFIGIQVKAELNQKKLWKNPFARERIMEEYKDFITDDNYKPESVNLKDFQGYYNAQNEEITEGFTMQSFNDFIASVKVTEKKKEQERKEGKEKEGEKGEKNKEKDITTNEIRKIAQKTLK